jgi:helix-turn-helix protein
MTLPPVRPMWTLFEPVHAVVYFAPQSRAAFEEAGLRGFWRGYFAGRAAPLGPVGPGPVYAAFYGFAPEMITRALPDVWQRATPAQALAARARGARTALTELLAGVAPQTVAAAAELARAAAEEVDLGGRVLAAANADLPWPDDPLDALWQAATVLREHRGDGHIIALAAAEVDGVTALAWRAALDNGREHLQPYRGWTDEQWRAALDGLTARGWLDAEGVVTGAGRAAHDDVERMTDRLAARPWRRLGPDRTERLAELLRPMARAASAVMPYPNPVGVPAPA